MFIVISLLLVAFIQGAIILHYGTKGGVIFSISLSFIITFLWHVFNAWAEGQIPNAAISDRGRFVFLHALLTFVVCISVMAFISFGLYYWAEFHKTGVLNKPVFFTWLVIFVVPPALYFSINWGKEYLKEKDQFENFISVSLKIFHFNEYPLYVDQVKFINTKNGRETVVKLENEGGYHSYEELAKKEISERIDVRDHHLVDKDVDIPLGTDEVLISYYSFTEDRYYSDTFLCAFDEPNEIYKSTGNKILLDLAILLKPEGRADFIFSRKKILPFLKIKSSLIGEEKKRKFIENFPIKRAAVPPEAYHAAINEINNSGRLQKRVEINERALSWKLSVQCKGSLKDVNIQDSRYLSYTSTYDQLKEVDIRNLPLILSFYVYHKDRAFCKLYFSMDIEKLYQVIESQTTGDVTAPIELSIVVQDNQKDKIRIFLKSGEQTTEFKDWIINIVNYGV